MATSEIARPSIISVTEPNTASAMLLRSDGQARKPLFLTLDRKKEVYAKQIFETGYLLKLEAEKQPLIPKRLFDEMLKLATADERERLLKVNEMALDKRLVHDIGDDLDQTVKRILDVRPDMKNGLAVLNGHNYVFTECDKYGGVARDLKKIMKSLSSNGNGTHSQLGSIFTSFLPIPFEGSKLDYGTWGRPAVIDKNIDAPVAKIKLSLVNVHTVKRFLVNDKTKPGMFSTDITDNVQSIVSGSKLESGFAVVTTLHTTVGIKKMKPSDIEQMYKDILEAAPDEDSLYYHNKVHKRGDLKLRDDGKPHGDCNGQSHVWAALTGSYTIIPFKNGKLQLERGERIIHHDYDKLPPRERGVAVAIIEPASSIN